MRPPKTLLLALLRFLLRHPWQFGLAILGVSLGVAVVISVDLTETSARRAFELATQGSLGKTTHRIIAGPEGVDENVYRQLKLQWGIRPATPIIEGQVQLPQANHAVLQVIGIDPITDSVFRSYTQASAQPKQKIDYAAFFTRQGVLMSSETAVRLGIERGQHLKLQVNDRVATVEVLALLEVVGPQNRAAMADTLLMDIATAQEILQLPGRLTHIDLIIADDPQPQALLAQLRAKLPPGLEIVPAAGRGTALQQMTRAFYSHLDALSLLALVVGVFLIYNTMSFVVVQQRRIIGILLAIGVTRQQIFILTLLQAGFLGLIGTLLGALFGVLLAHGLLSLVTRTINDIYFAVSVREVTIDAWSLSKGILLGLLGSLLAAFWPAREAASITPRRSLLRSEREVRFRHSALLAAVLGVVLCVVAALLLWTLPHGMRLSFAILALVLMGAALISPVATWCLAIVARPLLYRCFGFIGQYAARNVVACLSRTAVAIAALVLAIATTTSIALMIHSFRLAVNDWLGNLLRADYYVMANEHGSTRGPIDADLVGVLSTMPQVTNHSTARHITLESAEGLTHLAAYELAPASYAGFQFLEGDPGMVWPAFNTEEAVIVSEPYAYRHKQHPGGTIRLRTNEGEHRFRIVGVFRDYSTEHGMIAMHRKTFDRYWHDRGYGSVGLYVKPGTTTEEMRAEFAKLGTAAVRTKLISNRELRSASLEVFDRTFAITGILRLLAGCIAFVGVLSALLALQLDRTRELGVLRACGLTSTQLSLAVLTETGLLGSIAGILALPLGVAMAALLVFELNRQSFGWSMPLHIEAKDLWQGFALAMIAALLAGCYPAWRMSRTLPANALREEE